MLDGFWGLLLNFVMSLLNFMYMLYRYLLNPYTIVTCGGYSTVVLTNVSIVWALWLRLKGMLCGTCREQKLLTPGLVGSLHMQFLLSNVLPGLFPSLQPPTLI